MKNSTENSREELCNINLLRAGILRRAVIDYKQALKKRDYYNMEQLEGFFLSAWGELLSGGHGEYIIDHCREIVNKKRNIQKSIDN